MTSSFTALATATASTKRSPAVADGKRGARVTHLQSVSILPLMPASDSTMQHPRFQGTATELWETYTEAHAHTDGGESVTQVPDIRQGDVLVVDGSSYAVEFVADWPASSVTGAYLKIVVREDR